MNISTYSLSNLCIIEFRKSYVETDKNYHDKWNSQLGIQSMSTLY